MTIPYPFTTPVQWIARTRASGGSAYDGTSYTEAAAVPTSAVFAPGGSTEITNGGDTVTTQPTLYDVDVSLAVTALDLFVIGADRYEVDGKPQVYPPNPFDGSQHGQVIQLLEVSG